MSKHYMQPKLGFTLIEIMVALGVLSIVAASVAPVATRSIERMEVSSTVSEMKALEEALLSYYVDLLELPLDEDITNAQGLADLVTQPIGKTKWKGPYFNGPADDAKQDVWNNAYQYDNHLYKSHTSIADANLHKIHNNADVLAVQVIGKTGTGEEVPTIVLASRGLDGQVQSYNTTTLKWTIDTAENDTDDDIIRVISTALIFNELHQDVLERLETLMVHSDVRYKEDQEQKEIFFRNLVNNGAEATITLNDARRAALIATNACAAGNKACPAAYLYIYGALPEHVVKDRWNNWFRWHADRYFYSCTLRKETGC